MEQSLSDKIKVGSFLCTVFVVLRHSLNLQAFGLTNGNGALATLIEMGVSKQTEIAVPFFFIVSGFFFFRHTYYGRNEYVRMVAKKWHTLFMPFLFWSLVGMVVLLVTRRFVFEEEWWGYGSQLLHSDWNGVLWYVRDIMVMMLAVPLYGWIFSFNKRWLYLLIAIGLFIYWIPVDCSCVSSEGLLFFFLGGVIRSADKILAWRCPVWGVISLTLLWLFSCFFYPCYWPIHKYNTLVGIFLFWQMLNYIPTAWNRLLLRVAPYSFFIYVTHLYMVKAMKETLAKYYFGNEEIAMIAYVVIPVITILILFVVGKYWNKYMPQSFSFVTGGRG